MFAGISGNKYIDLRPLLAIAGCFGRRVKTVITRCYPTIYLLSTGLLVLTIYIDCARAMTVPVDSLPVAAVCSTPWEEVGFADDSQFCPEDRFIPDPDIGPTLDQGVVVDPVPSSVGEEDLDKEIFPVFILENDAITEVWSQRQPVRMLLAAAGFTIGRDDRVEPEGIVFPRAEIRIERAGVDFSRSMGLEENGCDLPNPDHGSSGACQEILTAVSDEDVPCFLGGSPEATHLVLPGASGEKHEAINITGKIIIDGTIEVTATAYCPGTPGSGCPLNSQGHALCTGCYNDGYTYTGKKAVQGEGTWESPRIIAVDPRIISLGSVVYLEGIGFAVAEDIGGAIKGNRIDLLFDLHQDTSKFGLQEGIRLYLLANSG